jgi:hypothetical protein
VQYDREVTKQKLAPIFDKLTDAVISANKLKQKALIPEAQAIVRKRDNSGLLNSFVTHKIREVLTGFPGINFKDKNGQLQVLVVSDYTIKVKQRGKWRLVDFQDTRTALDYLHQLNPEFPNLPNPAINLFLVYVLDITRTQIIRLSLICPKNEKQAYFEIDLIGEQQQSFPLMLEEATTNIPDNKPIVPKEKKKRITKNPKTLK